MIQYEINNLPFKKSPQYMYIIYFECQSTSAVLIQYNVAAVLIHCINECLVISLFSAMEDKISSVTK
jgi:hypothetical protein